MSNSSKKQKEIELKVNTNTVLGSTYSQIVGVSVTDDEVTLEFVYIHPRNKTQGHVVSRVSVSRTVAEELSKIIPITIKSHEDSKKE